MALGIIPKVWADLSLPTMVYDFPEMRNYKMNFQN